VLGAIGELAGSARGVFGDLLLGASQASHLFLEAVGDVSVLVGRLDSVLADGVAGHGDRGGDPLRGEVGDRLVAVGTEDEADGSAILLAGDELVDGVDVQVDLARELRLEGTDLQVDDDEATGGW
jgi:hypothetical protein